MMMLNMRPLFSCFLLLTCMSFSVHGNPWECIDQGCTCFRYPDYLEYQCPQNNPTEIIKVYQDSVKVECMNDDPPNFDMPPFNFSSMVRLRLHYCQIYNQTFRQVADRFGIKVLKNLTFELSSSSNDIHFTKELLEGLESLESLIIQFTNLTFDEDFLEDTPNLKELILMQNNIKEIGNIFKNLNQLVYLDLSVNSITTLPDFVFQNLTSLKILYLWQNKITSINKNTFTGLKQLAFIEMKYNKLREVPEDTFEELTNLQQVYLTDNKLKFVPKNLFRNNKLLTRVKFDRNNLTASYPIFSNLPNLTFVSLVDCKINIVPEDLFIGSTSIEEIHLKNNRIRVLPEKLFHNLNNTKILVLSSNIIEILPKDVFSSMRSLEQLFIDNNNLTNISGVVLNFSNLKSLKLNNNRLSMIDNNAFEYLKKLETIDLSHNNLSFPTIGGFSTGTPFNGCCEELEVINLANNTIKEFPQSILLAHLAKLKVLDLSKNLIERIEISNIIPMSTKINLTENKIHYVNFGPTARFVLEDNQRPSVPAELNLQNNPIVCDCRNIELVQYIRGDGDFPLFRQFIDIDTRNINCGDLGALNELKPIQVSCAFKEYGCPGPCDCVWRPADASVIVNCFSRNLTKAPVLRIEDENLSRIGYMFNQTIVKLQYNNLLSTPSQMDGYDNVTELDMIGNKLEYVNWVPPKIKVLNLSNNNLRTLDEDFIKVLKNRTTLQHLDLQNNPWQCDCSAVPLQKYLNDYAVKVHANNVKCAKSEVSVVNVHELCKSYLTIILGVCFTFLLIAAIFFVIFYIYELEIKVWLYAKNLCLWFITEDELDKDKMYDVFVSFSQKDEDFVTQKLLPNLEDIPNPFKVCVHYRDWTPGEYISEQVAKSVLNSRRTLVILSNNFLESIWGKMEFRTAHMQALTEGRARVILVILGELDETQLGDELKSYLKTNTYVKWGDPWFWNKLKYALPHRKSFYRHNQRHAKIMLTIDDKFELCKSPSTPHIGTTPPVTTLDPALLKEHPLYDKLNGEVPLMNGDVPRYGLSEVKVDS